MTMTESAAETDKIPDREEGEVWRTYSSDVYHTRICASIKHAENVLARNREALSRHFDLCKICDSRTDHTDANGEFRGRGSDSDIDIDDIAVLIDGGRHFVTAEECRAMRDVYRSHNVTQTEIATAAGRDRATVSRHITGRCSHDDD